MSSPEYAAIMENSMKLDRVREELEEVLIEINKMQKKLQSRDNSLTKLRQLYTRAKELSENEELISGLLITQLDTVIQSAQPDQQQKKIEGAELKKKRMTTDVDMPKHSQSIQNQLDALASLKGEQVAAKVTQENAEKDEWFVVKVIHFDRETKEFEVLDEEPGDDEEGGGQRKYKLPMSRIIPFPKRNDPTAEEFPPGKQVLAVYPTTTTLYKATVIQLHKRKNDDDSYVLEFDDDEEEDGSLPKRFVTFHRVVDLPEGHRQ